MNTGDPICPTCGQYMMNCTCGWTLKNIIDGARNFQGELNDMGYGKPEPYESVGAEMNTQQEIITWHKFPDEKPSKSTIYLVEVEVYASGNLKTKNFCTAYVYLDSYDGWILNFDLDDAIIDVSISKTMRVVAWAELPTGWKEEK